MHLSVHLKMKFLVFDSEISWTHKNGPCATMRLEVQHRLQDAIGRAIYYKRHCFVSSSSSPCKLSFFFLIALFNGGFCPQTLQQWLSKRVY